ncbi:hypothetical protein ZWY2020_052111 [Hordeum vulgare]|nr:hypothetical protein ZWY2020_052111 [Hordeum vulgare]
MGDLLPPPPTTTMDGSISEQREVFPWRTGLKSLSSLIPSPAQSLEGANEVPAHPKPARGGAVVTSRAVRANDQKVRQEEEDSNWEALRYGGGLPETDETQLGGEVDMDDVAFVDVDLEEEEEGVEETESWKLLGLYQVQKCPSAKTLSNHFEKI